LQLAARRTNSMALLAVAGKVQLDGFVKVKAAIDEMVSALKKEMADEVEHQRFCTSELDKNAKQTEDKEDHVADLESSIAEAVDTIETLTTDVTNLNADIDEMNVQLKAASEQRESDNKEFQQTVADQRATQTLLTKALARLELFYKKDVRIATQEAALVQQKVKQTPPAQFNAYKKSSGSSPVMGLLEQIIEDSKKLEAEAVSGETSAQADYEAMVKSSNEVSDGLTQSIALKTEQAAAAKLDSETAQADHTSAVGELESLAQYESDLHLECDFLLKNFDIRQRARLQEMEAIQDAKAILAGSAQL